MIDDIELQRRLRRTFDEVIPQLINLADASHPTTETVDVVLRRPTPRRAPIVLVGLGTCVALLAVVIGVAVRGSDDRTETPATSPSVTTPVESSTPSGPEPTPETSIAPATTSPPPENDGRPTDLTGSGTGLVMDPSAVPTDWVPVYAGEWASTPRTAESWATSTAVAARYSPDRSTVEDAVLLTSSDPAMPGFLDGGTSISLRGVDGKADVGRLRWIEDGRGLTLTAQADVDLVPVAEGIARDDAGGYSFTVLPTGFEPIVAGEVPAGRPTHYTRYVDGRAIDANADIVLSLIVGPSATPAEADLAIGTVTMPGSTPYAVTVDGRRVIVRPGGSAVISWDEPNGDRVDLEYSPLDGGVVPAERIEQALALVPRVRRADLAAWTEVVEAAPSVVARLRDRAFVTETMEALGLQPELLDRNLPISLTPRPRYGLVVSSIGPDGERDGACIFLLRALDACLSGDTLAALDQYTVHAVEAEGGFLRIVTGTAIGRVTLQSSGPATSGPVTSLLLEEPSPGVVIIPARTGPEEWCVTAYDADGDEILAERLVLENSPIRACA